MKETEVMIINVNVVRNKVCSRRLACQDKAPKNQLMSPNIVEGSCCRSPPPLPTNGLHMLQAHYAATAMLCPLMHLSK